jgi:hypothetical protein
MKKHLLIGTALLVAISAFPQSAKVTKPSGVLPMTPKKLNFDENASQKQTTVFTGPIKKSVKAVNGNAKVSSINIFTGSMNAFGYLVSASKPLQYNAALNAVSMVARKNGTYTASSNSNSGTQVGLYTTNMGGTWNETCLWANGTNLARYPQGGIYNPSGNTNINNAYLLATGPLVVGANWVGNYYASKQITTPGNTTPGTDQQAMLNATLPASMKKHHFSRYSFTAIDGGLVRSMSSMLTNPDGTTYAAIDYRGAGMIKGMFSAGAFVWSIDSFIPSCTKVSATAGGPYKNLSGVPYQAWDEAGVVGYVVMLGSRLSETLTATTVKATGGFQPIVYKTTNGGASWGLLPANDFSNMNCFQGVYDRAYPVTSNTALIVPNFQLSEGNDAVVDANGQLHFASMIVGHYSNHVDSLGYRGTFGTEQYNYPETGPFNYPIIYDFYTTATGWDYHMVDSMGTEGPSGTSGQPGYGSNGWSDGSGAKMDQDARIQMSRSVDGTKIFYTWTESDSTVTGVKWNIFPDLKVKGYDVNTKKVTARMDITNGDAIHTQAAYYHYTSNKAAVSAGTYTIPTTITKNATLDGSVNVDTYFNTNAVFPSSAFSINAMSPKNGCITGIAVQNAYNYEVSCFPNPANQATTILVSLKEKASNIEVTLHNQLGQVVSTYTINGQLGNNEVNVNLSGLSAGVYFYNVKVGNSVVTKKLIVQ